MGRVADGGPVDIGHGNRHGVARGGGVSASGGGIGRGYRTGPPDSAGTWSGRVIGLDQRRARARLTNYSSSPVSANFNGRRANNETDENNNNTIL